MKTSNKTQLGHSKGFTIVELMIATMVFSTILVAISIGVMYFTRSYYKGVYESSTQNAARNVAESITKAIQFNGSENNVVLPTIDTATGKNYLCAGGYIFVYQQGQKYTGSGTTGFYTQPLTGNCMSVPPASNQQQLLGKNMRIASITMNGSAAASYTVTVTVAYGDDDVLSATEGSNIACITGSGSEYCAVSTVTATAVPRIAN